jgi:hypothetical protein
MNRIPHAIPLFLAFAAHAQTGAAEPPVEAVGPLAIGAFAVLFFGAIALILTINVFQPVSKDAHTTSARVPTSSGAYR